MLDDARQREVCALLSAGCSLQAAAQYIQCAPNTIRREAERNPDFGRRFREARLNAQLSPLQAMRKAAASHWRAAAWMLERADPDHFGRHPPPAFRPKQAQTLKQDILAILSTEIEDPIVRQRVRRQIQHLIRYSIDGVVNVKRTDRQLRGVFREIDRLESEADERKRTAFDPPFPEVLSPSKLSPSKLEQSNPQLADMPLTWRDITEVLQELSQGAANANGTPAADPAAADPARGQPTELQPAQLQPTLSPAATADSTPPAPSNEVGSSTPTS